MNALRMRDILLILLGATALWFLWVFVRAIRARRAEGQRVQPRGPIYPISFVAAFFDTLGIGSFASTTTMVRAIKLLPDEHLPGTLNIGYVIPTITQAFIFIKIVDVDPITLVLLIVASVVGAWLGAPVVARMPRRQIQIGMGVALLVAATIFTMSQPQISLLPPGGNALKLEGVKLVAGIVGNFALGALMTLGIGLYGPCMILVYLLGMTPAAAFPIMMGSCAFLMPVASVKFIKERAFDAPAVVGMALTGVPAVLLAVTFFQTLSIVEIRWLVIVVVTIAAIGLLRAGLSRSDATPETPKA
jgi:uncharacterized membrane protein YfcA